MVPDRVLGDGDGCMLSCQSRGGVPSFDAGVEEPTSIATSAGVHVNQCSTIASVTKSLMGSGPSSPTNRRTRAIAHNFLQGRASLG